MDSRPRAALLISAGACTVLAAGLLLAAPATVADPAPLGYVELCNATGGTINSPVNVGGTNYTIHRFTTSGTFTPPKDMSVEYLIVGGGGGGGTTTANNRGGGGGGAGGVRQNIGSPIAVTGNTGYSVMVGAAGSGAAAASTAAGSKGTDSSVNFTGNPTGSGGGGGAGTTAASPGGSGGGGSGQTTGGAAGDGIPEGRNGGNGRSNPTRGGGGGGGQSAVGANATNGAAGAGGAGFTSTAFGSVLTTSVAGGGGGARGAAIGAAAGGSSVGGTGANSTTDNGGDAVALTGSGGGGGVGGGRGGHGSAGIVLIRYVANGACPSAPTASFSSPTLSWSAPTYVPTDQSIASYTVTYRLSTNTTSSGSIYARGSSATSINVTGLTSDDCLENNPGWICALGAGDMVSGSTYSFRVFARTDDGALGAVSSSFNYAVP